jgi:hypothetical protein
MGSGCAQLLLTGGAMLLALAASAGACEDDAGSTCSFTDCCGGLYCEEISWSPDRWCAKLGHPASLWSVAVVVDACPSAGIISDPRRVTDLCVPA